MPRAVIFDWFGTLAHWEHATASNYNSVLAGFGYEPDTRLIEEYHLRWDGVDHQEHSIDKNTYLAWTRERLRTLANDCGVEVGMTESIIEALINSDAAATMVLFPEVLDVLHELRNRDVTVGVCSNWGWDLEPFLEATKVAPLITVAVTSARAGFRKPHPGIYSLVLDQLGVSANEAIFVGDSWAPDVIGPSQAGMASIHISRGRADSLPALIDGSQRIGALTELLSMRRLCDDSSADER